MASVSNNSDYLRKFSQGELNTDNIVHIPTPSPTFVRMVVLDVISEPNAELFDEKKKMNWQSMGVTNMNYANILPRNTIIAKRIGEDVNPMFVFPFFPSHLSMPCKPGESVWVMFEKPDALESDMAFWFCRIVEPHISDDVNHSHPGRIFEISNNPSAMERHSNEKKGSSQSGSNVWHELRNAPVKMMGQERITARDNVILRNEKEDIFEFLVTQTNAAKTTTYESVPRFRKRPGDVAIEGSNNSLLVLGTDRKDSLDKTEFKSGSGTIDLVVGRGQTEKTSGAIASTTRIQDAKPGEKGTEIKKELDKSPDALIVSEGDPDLINDRSRILISQKTSTDKYFGLENNNSSLGLSDSSAGDASIVVKSDKIRLIARSDVQILVPGFKEARNPAGDVIKIEETDKEKWASITITSSGEIIIKPSEKGLIKLGGEKASKAILCTESLSSTGGTVTASPISTTMGGQLGVQGAASLGVWASKILVE